LSKRIDYVDSYNHLLHAEYLQGVAACLSLTNDYIMHLFIGCWQYLMMILSRRQAIFSGRKRGVITLSAWQKTYNVITLME